MPLSQTIQLPPILIQAIIMQTVIPTNFIIFIPLTLSAAAILLTLTLFYGQQTAQNQLIFNDSPFQFHVYCPIYTLNHPPSHLNHHTQQPIDIYAVYVKSKTIQNASGENSLALTYCGLARPWLGNCQQAQIICSSPGPMFYLPVNRPIDIIWVNSINSTNIEWPKEDCFYPESSDQFCSLDAKMVRSQGSQSCSFYDPTNLQYAHKKMRINKYNVAINTHIHGLSTRPVFDGNPLSWFSNSGQRGVGFVSLDDSEYFKQFADVDEFWGRLDLSQNRNIKINRILNHQPPGNLFYHDHTMRATRFNVKYGLTGLYILHDPQLERLLPSPKYEKFIVFSAEMQQDLRNPPAAAAKPAEQKPSQHPTHKPSRHRKCHDHKQMIYILNSSEIFQRGRVYRFRILNNHFDNLYRNISFAVYYKINTATQHNTILETDPTDPSVDLEQHRVLLPFTLIGADSSLFHQPIHNLTRIDLGTAERVELLIRFDQHHHLPLAVSHFYLLCFDANAGQVVIKFKFTLQTTTTSSNNNIEMPASEFTFGELRIPYTDLSAINDKEVAVRRMKPLFSRPSDQKFIINGHYMFEKGASDQPQIGTIEDWYFINNPEEEHPIHIHLVNYQVVRKFTLKMFDQDCTFFQLDYYRLSGYPPFQNHTNQQLCDLLKSNITSHDADMLYQYLSDFYLQNITRMDDSIGRITGFNVLEKIISADQKALYDVGDAMNCSYNSLYKYICDDVSHSIPPHYKRWKDTSIVQGLTVSVLRIRWTKTDYDPSVEKYPYFNIPEEQLMQFPGFLYHCHILPHQDNEMMRPYMLQPSEMYLKKVSEQTHRNGNSLVSWSVKVDHMNREGGCL